MALDQAKALSRLKLDNPWWETGRIDNYYSNFQKRPYFDLFYPLIQLKEIKRAVVLMGPRRVGKTVMLYHAIANLIAEGVPVKKICFLSLQTPIYNGIPLEDLFSLFQSATNDRNVDGYYIFFDEIQYLKDWELQLKVLVDTFHRTKFIVSGSAAAALKMKSRESGAGRFTDFLLPPLSFYEYIHLRKLHKLVVANDKLAAPPEIRVVSSDIVKLNEEFIRYINYGGYPEIALNSNDALDTDRYLRDDILDKVLLKDLPSLYGIDNVQDLYSLFTTLAFQTSKEVSLDDLNQESGLNKDTVRKYLTFLEAAYLIKLVPRIDYNSRHYKRASTLKIYLTNPSIRSALFGPISTLDGEMGCLVETAIYAQYMQLGEPLRYARWPKGEVDLVLLDNLQKPAFAIEVKWSDSYFENQIRKLNQFASFIDENKLEFGIVTTITKSGSHEFGNNTILFYPTSVFAYLTGYINLGQRKSNFKKEMYQS